jgi:hypothetical protein
MLLYEHRNQPLLSRRAFAVRLARHGGIALALIAVSLGIGVCGYRFTAGLGWLDALLNASMILTGMGPVDKLETPVAKLFASAYALFSGVAFLGIVGVLVAPVAHRILHHFHLAEEDPES